MRTRNSVFDYLKKILVHSKLNHPEFGKGRLFNSARTWGGHTDRPKKS